VREGGDDLIARARRRDPADLEPLRAARATAGRRGDHALLVALADHGDPRALVDFRDALRARDVDPGRGFTQRRLAADGLGALGLRAGVPLVAAALRDEQADFEGRPGAGLGIQYPVRANLLYALGEIGHPSAIPLLVPYLDDASSSALGGLDLPAMDSLFRIGRPAIDPLRRARAGLGERGRANASALLGALLGGQPRPGEAP
ncbi:MAG: HEAT repeat domain-containing protein, partial [Deltaproteobacteria bacterium]|nr:HEAT repeat domain-containing protein [Deltaproteobacteria bacterium]